MPMLNLTGAAPTSRDSILKVEILFRFSIWFNQGISPSALITEQVNSSSLAEEASEIFTQYSMGRWDDNGVNYRPLYAENMGWNISLAICIVDGETTLARYTLGRWEDDDENPSPNLA